MPAKSTPAAGNRAGRQNNQADHGSLDSAVLTVSKQYSGILLIESGSFPETTENQKTNQSDSRLMPNNVKQIKSKNELRRSRRKNEQKTNQPQNMDLFFMLW